MNKWVTTRFPFRFSIFVGNRLLGRKLSKPFQREGEGVCAEPIVMHSWPGRQSSKSQEGLKF